MSLSRWSVRDGAYVRLKQRLLWLHSDGSLSTPEVAVCRICGATERTGEKRSCWQIIYFQDFLLYRAVADTAPSLSNPPPLPPPCLYSFFFFRSLDKGKKNPSSNVILRSCTPRILIRLRFINFFSPLMQWFIFPRKRVSSFTAVEVLSSS